MENTWKANTQEAKAGKLQTWSSLYCIETEIQKEKATKTFNIVIKVKIVFLPCIISIKFYSSLWTCYVRHLVV